jgi:uncharacterized membrane-anchored protein YitT (DUF2179 family)
MDFIKSLTLHDILFYIFMIVFVSVNLWLAIMSYKEFSKIDSE